MVLLPRVTIKNEVQESTRKLAHVVRQGDTNHICPAQGQNTIMGWLLGLSIVLISPQRLHQLLVCSKHSKQELLDQFIDSRVHGVCSRHQARHRDTASKRYTGNS